MFLLMDLEINNTNTNNLDIIYIFENNLIIQILLGILIFFSLVGYLLIFHLIYIKFIKKYFCIYPIYRLKRKQDLVIELGTLEHKITD